MNSIPIELHYEGERESLHLESTIEIQQGMCATYLLVSTSPHHEVKMILHKPALRELARQSAQMLGATT